MIPDIVKQHPDVGFVVVDPLTAFCDTGTKADDGLAQSWLIPKDGWLFLNPPWDAPRGEPKPIPLWVDKLLAEISCGNVPRAIVLLPFKMSRAFEKLIDAGAAYLNLGRLKFGKHNNTHREDTACLVFGFDPSVPQRIVEEARRNGLSRAKMRRPADIGEQ